MTPVRLALAAFCLAATPAFAAPTQAQTAAEGPLRGSDEAAPKADPPPLRVTQTRVDVDAGPTWQVHDVRALCGVEAGAARVRIEEVAGRDARAAADVAIDGPTTLRLRASSGKHLLHIELSATDADGNQAFDRCRVQVR